MFLVNHSLSMILARPAVISCAVYVGCINHVRPCCNVGLQGHAAMARLSAAALADVCSV